MNSHTLKKTSLKDDLNADKLSEMVSGLLKNAKQKGASSAEVSASIDDGFSVTSRLAEVETVEYNRDKGLGITVYFGQRSGSASTSDTRPDALQDILNAACHIAKLTGEDPYNGLADPERMATDFPDLDLYHPSDMTTEQAIIKACSCEQIGLDYDKAISNSDGVTVYTHRGLRVYGNSHGFMGELKTTRHGLSCVLLAKAGDSMQRDYYYTSARDATDLLDKKIVAEMAAERTIKRLNGRPLSTRTAPVIFAAEIAKSLFSSFLSAIKGSNLYRDSSFLLDHIGKPVFSKHIQIEEKSHILKALGSAPFDAEGVKTEDKALIIDGVLQSYLLNSYSARKLNLKTTGNAGGTHNVFISTSNKNLIDLLNQMDTGLLVTEVMGQGVNIVTGDYSRGASGFWVENGEIQYPVEEITIAGNLKDMYQQIVIVGNDIDRRGSLQTGSVLIETMAIGGH